MHTAELWFCLLVGVGVGWWAGVVSPRSRIDRRHRRFLAKASMREVLREEVYKDGRGWSREEMDRVPESVLREYLSSGGVRREEVANKIENEIVAALVGDLD